MLIVAVWTGVIDIAGNQGFENLRRSARDVVTGKRYGFFNGGGFVGWFMGRICSDRFSMRKKGLILTA